jgi:large subunit ribosomal protein L9
VPVHLHAEVASTVIVNVARSEDEAERQSAGEDLTVVSYEEEEETEAAPAIEEVFEEGAAEAAAAEVGEVADQTAEAPEDGQPADEPAAKAAAPEPSAEDEADDSENR